MRCTNQHVCPMYAMFSIAHVILYTHGLDLYLCLTMRVCLRAVHSRQPLRKGRECLAKMHLAHNAQDSRSLSLWQIHEVAARRFCLVSADHPLVSAISENGMTCISNHEMFFLYISLASLLCQPKNSRWGRLA